MTYEYTLTPSIKLTLYGWNNFHYGEHKQVSHCLSTSSTTAVFVHKSLSDSHTDMMMHGCRYNNQILMSNCI